MRGGRGRGGGGGARAPLAPRQQPPSGGRRGEEEEEEETSQFVGAMLHAHHCERWCVPSPRPVRLQYLNYVIRETTRDLQPPTTIIPTALEEMFRRKYLRSGGGGTDNIDPRPVVCEGRHRFPQVMHALR